jgi:glycosyltransferase A (GT-A) superfamily protein (DUF2064 family)
LIGSDLPPVPLRTLDAAYAALSGARDIVLGPAADGGYYLVGMGQLAPELFRDMRWSRSDVLERTLERVRCAGLSYALLPPWFDVDAPEDIARLSSEHQAQPFLMKNTLSVLQELRERGKL